MISRFKTFPGRQVLVQSSYPPAPALSTSTTTVTAADGGNEVFTVVRDTKTGNHNVDHPHEFTRYLILNYDGQYSDTRPYYNGQSSGLGLWPFTHTAILDRGTNNLFNTALDRLYEEMRGSVDLAVDISQAKQTRAGIKEYKDLLIPLADDLAREAGKLVRFARRFSWKQWGNRWLEYQYGWKPLVQGIYDAGARLLDFHKYSYVRIRGTANETITKRAVYNNVQFLGSIETVDTTLRKRAKIYAEFKMSNSVVQSLAGYTSLNPVSLAWELLPYSFVVDWFYNVGGYIRNMENSYIYGLVPVRSYAVEGYLQEDAGRIIGTGYYDPGFQRTLNGSGLSYARQSWKRRSIPALQPRVPNLNLKLGTERLFSAAALLSQQLKGPQPFSKLGRRLF